MNLRNLSPKVRALVEALTEPATEQGFDVIDVDEDDNGVVITLASDPAFAADDEEDEDR